MNDCSNGEQNHIDASMTMLLSQAAKQLVPFLEKVLPSISDKWWEQCVLNALSFQQRRRIEQQKVISLVSLDLAALLRVLDQNWYQISAKLELPSETRHFVKEMQTVRNRWAHAGTEDLPIEDTYRDMDTLQRLATVIGADANLIQQVRNAKKHLLVENNAVAPNKIEQPNATPELESHVCEFAPGQIVCLKSNPAITGAVVSVCAGKPENRCLVFVAGEIHTYYSSQIQKTRPQNIAVDFLPCDQFHAYLTALQIRHPSLSTLYSLNAARIDFIPYQFRPVLRFIKSDRPRLLIADGVGVGKTIEAGLILREIQARRDIRSVLIICPRPLVTERKWQREMKRFEENFTHLDGGTLRYCINEMDLDGVWPEQHQRVIIPYSLFDEVLLHGNGADDKRKRKKGLLDLDPPPRFDLVIVDEAHHIRNSDTYSHKAVRFFCDHAEAVVFLTATPIQLGNQDLFVLLNTLRPDLIIDRESFEHMAEPNPFINRAIAAARAQGTDWTNQTALALDDAASTPWGQAILRHNPEFNRIRTQLTQETIVMQERVQIITNLESLHTFSGVISRTRRRDIGNFTIRKPETVVVEFTPSQKEVHDDLLKVQAEIFSNIHGDISVNFMMTTIRRQAASCLFGLVPFLEDILNRHIDELSWEETDDTQQVPLNETIDSIEVKIQNLLDKTRRLDTNDPKLEALRKIIKGKAALTNNRVMLFSSFRHTLNYLYKKLADDGFRIGMVHGGTPDEDRIHFRQR